MKIDRLIGILAILLQQEKVTAPYLADKFEVSRRTINRDIEAICKAGIPIMTVQGPKGGISIMEGYRIDKTLLTLADMRAILAGLRSLDSVSKTNKYQQLMAKLSVESSDILTSNQHIVINLSSWYKSTLAPKIELIQTAIERREKICFTYYSPRGESHRVIEPGLLVFQWSSWYVWGYCCEKADFRLFKLNRMLELENIGETFGDRDMPMPDLSPERVFPTEIIVKAIFEPDMKWRLIEEYGIHSFQEREDGKLLFAAGFKDRESALAWILGFRDRVELVEPADLREEFRQLIETISRIYLSLR